MSHKTYMSIVCSNCLKLQSNIKHCSECGKRITAQPENKTKYYKNALDSLGTTYLVECDYDDKDRL